MYLSEAIDGARRLAFRYKTTAIVYWKQANNYAYATEHRLLSGKRQLNRWRYRVHPDGSLEKV